MGSEKNIVPQVLNPSQISLIKNKTPKEYLKQRQGRGGKILHYVETSYVINQLNQIFGFKWDFEITESSRVDNQIIVLGKLTVKGKDDETIIKTQYGGAKVKKTKEDKKIIDLADDYKAAASDCLKKCASLIGIALDVFSGETKLGRGQRKAPEQVVDEGVEKIEVKAEDEMRKIYLGRLHGLKGKLEKAGAWQVDTDYEYFLVENFKIDSAKTLKNEDLKRAIEILSGLLTRHIKEGKE